MAIRFERSLAYVNKNPLNIRYVQQQYWVGQIDCCAGFVVFDSFAHGYRAAVKLLRKYHLDGYRTIPQIIGRWAPASENKTDEYVKYVLFNLAERQSEPFTVDADTVMDLRNRELIVQLMVQMTKVEMGANAAQAHKLRPAAELGYDLAVTTPDFFKGIVPCKYR